MDDAEGFLCATCGLWHPGLPDCAYRRPDDLLLLTPARRARCKESDDMCVIVPPRGVPGFRRFYLRGVLAAPLTDRPGESFAWGIWVRVRKGDFQRAVELWNEDGTNEPPFSGRLANKISGFTETPSLPVLLRLGDESSRPSVEVADRKHPLWKIQRDGLSAHAAYEHVQGFNRG